MRFLLPGLVTSVILSNCRRTRLAFLRRLLFGPRMRISLPLLLYLNRLAVALWVLILGIM